MTTAPEHRITSVAQLRALVGEPSAVTPLKLGTTLDDTARDFIARSPFLLLATSDAQGRLDVSPKGDPAGFVLVEDERTLVLPDRKGNRLVFGHQNVLENPQVALIFLVPGTGETLRVSGTAELTVEPALLARLSARGQPAILAVRVHVAECFFHCARAFLRAGLWEPDQWGTPLRISFGTLLAPRAGGDDAMAAAIDRRVAEGYEDL